MERSKFNDSVEGIKGIADALLGDKRVLGIVEGTGWPDALDEVFSEEGDVSYGDLPLPSGRIFPSLQGHRKRLAVGKVGDRDVLRIGRIHLYEGADVAFDMRAIIAALRERLDGVLVTNGVGSLQGDVVYRNGFVSDGNMVDAMATALRLRPVEKHRVHDLVAIDSSDFGYVPSNLKPLFPSDIVDINYNGYYRENGRYLEIVREAIASVQGECTKAVYAFWSGPDFETPEVKMRFRANGCDVIGMSGTESYAAVAEDVPFAQVSLVTNPMFGEHKHEDNTAAGLSQKDKIGKVAVALAEAWPRS